MTASSAIIITPPDDVLLDCVRLLCIDLDHNQSQLVSSSITDIDYTGTVGIYIWNSSDPIEWLLDKKSKADIILFNAESTNEIIVGYMAAQKNAYYFGNLKLLAAASGKNIYGKYDLDKLVKEVLENYENS
jgi:hypothetical protein